MRIHFYSPNRIEPWDYRNVFDVGIGGSETSHVELAIRLAARGHDVASFTALPQDGGTDPEFCGVRWCDLSAYDIDAPGLHIVYRHPVTGRGFTPAPHRKAWLVCQDVFYPDWKSEDVSRFDKVIGLCPRHLDDIAGRDPANAGRLVLSGNAANVERADRVLAERLPRKADRLVWTSSPDRGLKELLTIFDRAREVVPTLTLDIFYGMDNIEKICGGDRTKHPWVESWRQYDRACAMPGVTWRGRIGQQQLAREIATAGIWCYPTWFPETSCISCMEAQVLGAIPVTNPIWATGYNVRHGVFVEGTPSDKLVTARYVDAVARIAANPEAQESVRGPMMAEARERLSWERVADQWDRLAQETFTVKREVEHAGA